MEDEITLEDIENMISILTKFLTLSKRVEKLLYRFTPRGYGYFGGDIMKALLQSALARKGEVEGEEWAPMELTDEEKKTLEKIRKKKIVSAQSKS